MDFESRATAGGISSLQETQSTDLEGSRAGTETATHVNVDREEETIERLAINDFASQTEQPDLSSLHNATDSNVNVDTGMENVEDTGLERDEETASESIDRHHMEYQPTAEEIEAARMWDQVNNEDIQFRDLTEQERADAELALILQAQLEDGYNSDNDRDTAPESLECACGDYFTWQQALDMITLNCGHVRCNDCLNQNVSVGLEVKRNYPPRCCGIGIEVELVQDHLSDENILRWVEVKDEFEDRAPVYCAFKTCSVYLTKDTLDVDHKWALCPNCNVRTCSGCLCLESDHVESDKCPERIDKMDKELMTKKKWKLCPGCRHMIERIEGCDHITCECGMEFCYQCGREYVGGMPCNCYGQRNWVEDEPEANNPAMQQQILNNLNRIAQADEGEHENGESDEEDNEGENENGEREDVNNAIEEPIEHDGQLQIVDHEMVEAAEENPAMPWNEEVSWGFEWVTGTTQVIGSQLTDQPGDEHQNQSQN